MAQNVHNAGIHKRLVRLTVEGVLWIIFLSALRVVSAKAGSCIAAFILAYLVLITQIEHYHQSRTTCLMCSRLVADAKHAS